MKSKFFALLLIAGINQAYAQKSDFQLKYEIEIKSDNYGEGERVDTNGIPETFTNDLLIQLQKEGSFFTSGKEKTVTYYDLEREMIFIYNKDTLYSAIPIYSVID